MKYQYDIYREYRDCESSLLATFYNPISAIKYVHSIRIDQNLTMNRDQHRMELVRDGYTEIRNIVIVKENIK